MSEAEHPGEHEHPCPFCHYLPRVVGSPPRLARHFIDNEVCQGSGAEIGRNKHEETGR